MIDFRYHLVSITAIFLALALGLFIGATSLRGVVASDITSRTDHVIAQNSELKAALADSRAQVNRERGFEAALAPRVVAGQLSGRTVALVTAPGVSGDIRTGVQDALSRAGAAVTADIQLRDSLLDPQQSTFLDTLVTRLDPALRRGEGSGSARALDLLAAAIGGGAAQAGRQRPALGTVLSAFTAGRFVTSTAPSTPAALVVILVPAAPGQPPPSASAEVPTLLTGFAGALDDAGMGVVVAGPAAATASGGVLAAVRSDSSVSQAVSTVDSVDQPSGVIATILSLADMASGHRGAYGTGSDHSPPVPTPSPS